MDKDFLSGSNCTECMADAVRITYVGMCQLTVLILKCKITWNQEKQQLLIL